MGFKGKVAIVTGSSAGIGQATAEIFATEGASVTIHGQSEERLKATADLLKKLDIPDSRVLVVRGAIEDKQTQKRLIDETVTKFGRLDILVNNAAVSYHDRLDPNSLENFDYVMDVNLRSLIALTRMAIPHLAKTKGNVVNISSVGSQRVIAISQPYVLTKAALDHFTRNAAVQYAEQGIRVNTVSPGAIRTLFRSRHDIPEDRKNAIENYVDRMLKNDVPMQRSGSAREVANVIVFLASDKASYVTGANYVVDGGVLAGAPTQKVESK
ncbi:putative oxidoreductase YxbG-like protein [Aphelenchoides besseyi]|nr:putative oxidoreductase YxbG-like protein [Aphelenchoides besseyi]KAI6211732.1 putative oxidoreductase YxbG-like protein [Aphelenchoides besseyi]